MKIYIHGTAPNTCINLEAETQAERDQIQRLKHEAKISYADVLGYDHDPVGTLRIRLENKAR